MINNSLPPDVHIIGSCHQHVAMIFRECGGRSDLQQAYTNSPHNKANLDDAHEADIISGIFYCVKERNLTRLNNAGLHHRAFITYL